MPFHQQEGQPQTLEQAVGTAPRVAKLLEVAPGEDHNPQRNCLLMKRLPRGLHSLEQERKILVAVWHGERKTAHGQEIGPNGGWGDVRESRERVVTTRFPPSGTLWPCRSSNDSSASPVQPRHPSLSCTGWARRDGLYYVRSFKLSCHASAVHNVLNKSNSALSVKWGASKLMFASVLCNSPASASATRPSHICEGECTADSRQNC